MAQNRTRERRAGALRTRLMASEIAFNRLHAEHRSNGDETTVEDATGTLNFAGNYAKGLLHAPSGDVDPAAYGTMLQALASGDTEAFERIRHGVPAGSAIPRRKLTNPQAGLAFSLAGPDAQEPTLPPAPTYGSAETAAEAAELYWMVLLRDVPFTAYATNGIATRAATSLSAPAAGEFSVETSPRDSTGAVTADGLFRGTLPGDLVGPYVSQFLLQGTQGPCPPDPANSAHATQVRQDGMLGYGAQRIDQRIITADPGQNFLLDVSTWLDSQNGRQPNQSIPPDCATPKFIRNLRDLGVHVRADRNYQHYLNAALLLQNVDHLAASVPDRNPIMLPPTPPGNPDGTDFGNPYNTLAMQEGFATFGDWHLLALLAEVTTRALQAAWYQKWFVHRRLRPEEYGGRVNRRFIAGAATTNPDIHGELIASLTGGQLSGFYGPAATMMPRFNNYLLPQAFPEGSPLHPAYPSGHATVAGACVTLLKAWFDDERPLTHFLPDAFVPSADGERLDPAGFAFPDTHLLAHELNKLASNVSIGRNGAGVHWRSDYYRRDAGNQVVLDPDNPMPPYPDYATYQQDAIRDLGGIALGEQVAIGFLQEQALTYNEERRDPNDPTAPFGDFFFTFLDFRNRRIRITANGAVELG